MKKNPVKIIVAPDSFKGTFRATEVCRIWKDVFAEIWHDAELVCLPLADGGEGSLDAVIAATGAKRMQTIVADPLSRPCNASWALLPNGSAFIEAAEANGLEKILPSEKNPMITTTYGVGQLIKEALGQGVRTITIGIGGSATVDGGAGMLQALGYKLLDKAGRDIQPGGNGLASLASIIPPSSLPPFTLNIACDVTNPLLGEQGAVNVFAPQKGATPEMMTTLEQAMVNYASLLRKIGIEVDMAGDGAAGGLGCALRAVLGGRMQSGAKLIASLAGLEKQLEGASLLITGEGCSDVQTLSGKLPTVIADIAAKHGVPAILCSGAINDNDNLLSSRFAAVFSTVPKPGDVESILSCARENLLRTARSIVGLLSLGDNSDG